MIPTSSTDLLSILSPNRSEHYAEQTWNQPVTDTLRRQKILSILQEALYIIDTIEIMQSNESLQ